MANYETLKANIAQVITTNGNNEITGAILRSLLISIVTSLGDGYQYKGIAKLNTNPGTPDQKVFYLATRGTYVNFDNKAVTTSVGVLKYDGTWTVEGSQIANLADVVPMIPAKLKKNLFDRNGYISGYFINASGNLQANASYGVSNYFPVGEETPVYISYSGSGNVGTGGLEEYYNDTLNGVVGRKYGYLDEGLNMEQTMIEAKDGNNLVLTLDANIQSIVQKSLNQFNAAFQNQYREGLGANNAACIVMDCNSGEVLAMAGTPFFDLNHPSDLAALWGMPKLDQNDEPQDGYLTYTDLLTMTEEDKPRYLNALWRNFCISDYYEPGSTAKPFTVAMGLDTGTVSDSDEYYCGGYKMIDGFKIQCHTREGDGWLTTGEAVEYSCNVALMEMVEKIGKENFTKFQNVYNFGLKTGIDLADEARTDQFVSDATMTNSMLATTSFGQNFDATMIQMAAGFCSLINGGNYYEPHVVKKITSPSGMTLKTIEPRVLKKTVSESTSAHIRDYTVMVVEGHNGTGITARPAGYRIGGKTGTAETLPRGNDEYVVSFLGYAPAEDPQIVCYAVVDRANIEEQDNPMYATAIFKNVMEEVLPYMGIYMTEPVTDKERERLDKKGLEVTYTGDESPDKWDWADDDEDMY